MNMTPWDNTAEFDMGGYLITGAVIGTAITLTIAVIVILLIIVVGRKTPKMTDPDDDNALSTVGAMTIFSLMGAPFGLLVGVFVGVGNIPVFWDQQDQSLQAWVDERYSLDIDTDDAHTLRYSTYSRTDLAVTIDGKLTNVHLVEADKGGVLLATSESSKLIDQK
jgi:hypothetical protein